MSEKPRESWLRKAFTRNLGAKVLAVAIAVVFFYTRETESISHRTLSIPVIAMLDPGEDRILVSEFPEQVTLRLQGPVSVLKELRSQDVGPAVVPVMEIEGHKFRFSRGNFNLPDAVKITKIYPEAVPVQFEERATKEVPLSPEIRGKPPEGRFLGEKIQIQPRKVLIAGAKSAVDRVQRWETEPIYVDELDPGKHDIELTLAPPKLANVYLEQEITASVSLEIKQNIIEKWVRQIPIGIEGVKDHTGITVKPANASAYVRGPEEDVQELTADHLNIYATLSEEELMEPGNYPKPVMHDPPPQGSEFVKVVPLRVMVVNRSPAALKQDKED